VEDQPLVVLGQGQADSVPEVEDQVLELSAQVQVVEIVE
jgi:hypothetical protein